MKRLLVVVLLVGLVLRLIGIGSSFWVDEVDTVVHCVRLPLRELVTTYPSENQHPLYSLLAHLCVAAFGEHEWSVRLPAVLFGVAGIAALHRLGSQFLGVRAGLLAALLLAVSEHAVWFAQNARGYTGLLLFTLLATSEFATLLRSAPGTSGWRAPAARYALWFALAMYTHLTAIFLFAGHGLVWLGLAATRRADRRPLFALLAGGALSLLLYAPMADDVVRAFTARVEQTSTAVVRVEPWTRPAWALQQVVASLGGGRSGWAALVALGVVALLAAVGFVSLWRKARPLVLLHVAALPIAALFLLGLHRHLYPRFFFFEAGFLALVVVQGALMSGGWISCNLPGCGARRQESWGVALALLVAAGSSLTLQRVYAHPKQDFVGARDFVESQSRPGDVKIAVGPAKLALPGYYAPTWKIADRADELAALQASAPHAWVVYTLPDQLRAARPDVAEAIARDFDLVATFPGSLGGGELYVVRSRDRER